MKEYSALGFREDSLQRSRLDFPVVGIGASAGGVKALQSFFQRVPADCGMAFVVVLHVSPKHTSDLAATLQAETAMQVMSPGESRAIERNHVYVVGPGKLLSMNDSYLSVSELERPQGRQGTIDLFFRTLAVVHRERAFAVILSGTGSDGTVGITRIKEEGGVTFAQTPGETGFDGMPRAAIESGAVDWVLPAADMPGKLMELWRNARRIELPGATDAGPEDEQPVGAEDVKEAEEALKEVLMLVRTRTGHDFRNYKRATVLRRIERRLQVHGLPNLPAYRNFIHVQPEEAHALLKDLLIGVTNFFRDAEAFDLLQQEVIAPLVEQAAKSTSGLRAWVPGCATGEEAYSLAMMFCEQSAHIKPSPKVHLFATDIDEAAIGMARMGCYPAAIETDVDSSRLRRFFDKDGDQYRIRKEVREKVMFAAHNILRDPPFSKLDLISCRNLLIYLDREVHAEVLEMFHFALKPGGYLFLGSSESADTVSQLFTVVDKKNRVFRASTVARAPRYVPVLPMGLVYPSVAPLADQPRPDKRNLTYADIHQRLAEQHAPPSVLIDAEGNVVHVSKQAGRFLHYASGEPSHQLLSLVQPELRLELRTALFQAARNNKSVEARRVHVVSDGRSRYVTMIVRPVQEAEVGGQLSMVLFDEVEDSMASDERAANTDGRDPVVVQLEDELRRVKEQLQGTIEQSETSTEELRASNEELQAINEELRSTTEELETSKEELQSINEELITVNNELKTKVEETSKINDDLQNLIASTDIATVFVDRGMSIKRYTPHATRLFNLIPTDVGRSLLDITHKLDYPALADDAAEAFQSLRMIEREITSQDGKWYLARVLPYRTTEDRIDGAVLTFVDITSRRQAEETMRLVAESARDHGYFTFDVDGRVLTWNQGAERLFQYAQADIVGQSAHVLFTPEDLEGREPMREMEKARAEGRVESERWHVRKDGARVRCSGLVTPLYRDGRLLGYSKICRELVRRTAGEPGGSARRSNEGWTDAQRDNALTGAQLALLTQALKGPLNLIQLKAELLMRMPDARALPDVVDAAATIRHAVLHQGRVIDDFFDVAALQSGAQALHRAPMDLVASLREAVDGLSDKAGGKGIAMEVRLPESPVMVDAEAGRLQQVWWNLLDNAVKFTGSGGRIDVRLDIDAAEAKMRIGDSGAGIDAHRLQRLFDPLAGREAGQGGRTGQQGGLGIGLAVVSSVVVAHGGRVEAESGGPGQGSAFTVFLPLMRDGGQPAGEDRALKALLVDGDAQSAMALRQLLELEGIDVRTAGTGTQVLRMDALAGIDVVLCDTELPDMDARAFVRALRAMPGAGAIPVIGLAASDQAGRFADEGEGPFTACFNKPVSFDKLLQKLKQRQR